MKWWKLSTAGVLSAVLVAGVRAGAVRAVLGSEQAHEATRPCGMLLWRTRTVTRESVFEPAHVVRSESVLEANGERIADEIQDVVCRLRDGSAFVAIVLLPAGNGKRGILLVGPSGTREGEIQFEHDVAVISVSDGSWVAAVSPAGEISVADLAEGARPMLLSRRPDTLPGSLAWSPDATTLCWVHAQTPGASEGSAELWCSRVPEAAARVTRATWAGSDVAIPWAGFQGKNAHLCGDALHPRDLDCLGIARTGR